MMETRRLYINGEWVESASTETVAVENPATRETVALIPAGTDEDAVRALEAAQDAQPAGAALPAIRRAELLNALAGLVVRDKEHLTRVITAEQGKPLRESGEELGGTETFLRWAAESAAVDSGRMQSVAVDGDRLQSTAVGSDRQAATDRHRDSPPTAARSPRNEDHRRQGLPGGVPARGPCTGRDRRLV